MSIILIAAGAILAWAIDVHTSGFNLNTIGYILVAVGALGLLVSLIFWSSWGGPGFARRETVVREEPPAY